MASAVKPNDWTFQQSAPPPPQHKNAKIPYFISVIFVMLMVILMVLWCSAYQGGYYWGGMQEQWNWHSTLNMFGFSIFFAESILVFKINKRTTKSTNRIMHVIMNFIGLVLTTIGLAATFTVNSKTYASFFSFHSWIGIATYILFVGQFACGIFTHLIPVLPQSFSRYHKECGIAIYIFAVISVATGMMLRATTVWNYALLRTEAFIVNFMGLSFVIFSVIVLYIVVHPQYI